MCVAVNCSWFLCVELLSYVYFCKLMCIVLLCVYIAVLHTLIAGLLARSQRPEDSTTGPPHRVFLVSVCLKANAEMVPKTPRCHCMLLM